jgi:dTDP-4-amino-4,6-dideoxygalactose transaminase
MIPLFRPKFRTQECLDEIERCLSIGWSGQGFLTNDFESEWKSYTGEKNAIFVNSASAALHLALESMKLLYKWEDDCEIISSPLTFVTTNHSILWSGLKPVLVDVNDALCLSADEVVGAITSKTRAVIYVAIGGNSSELEKVRDICNERNLKLILDAAHAAGSRVNSNHMSSFADATCYSFQAVKNLPTADSGLLAVKDSEVHEMARRLSWCGISESTYQRTSGNKYKWEYDVEEVGFKENGNSVMAALALVGLRYLDKDNSTRREIFKMYQDRLASQTGIKLLGHSNEIESSRHLVQVLVANRQQVIEDLAKEEIGAGVHYRTNTAYPMYAHFAASTTRASALSAQVLSLPIYLDLTEQEVNKVCEVILRRL